MNAPTKPELSARVAKLEIAFRHLMGEVGITITDKNFEPHLDVIIECAKEEENES